MFSEVIWQQFCWASQTNDYKFEKDSFRRCISIKGLILSANDPSGTSSAFSRPNNQIPSRFSVFYFIHCASIGNLLFPYFNKLVFLRLNSKVLIYYLCKAYNCVFCLFYFSPPSPLPPTPPSQF